MARPAIIPGMVVTWTARAGYWDVIAMESHPDTHSAIPIPGALIQLMNGPPHPRHARLADIKPVPPDLEDWPC